MNKTEFMYLLECALLRWDGATEEEMLELGATDTEAVNGIKLHDYLRSIEFYERNAQRYVRK